MIFDTLAHEYGYTNNQIGAMTLREIDSAFSCINKRKSIDYNFHASIHGVQLNMKGADDPGDKKEPEKMPEGMEQKAAAALQARIAEKQAELRKKHGQ